MYFGVHEYRGHLIVLRGHEVTGCDRIAGPDGTWRYSPPTWVGIWSEWLIFRPMEPGWFEKVDAAVTEQEALQKIDQIVGAQ